VIIGIDQGTSSTRAWLMDERGVVRARASREHAQHHPRPGWVEHDAEEIWRATEEVLAATTDRRGARVDGIGLANQGETVVLFDRRDGRALGRAITWQDDRTQAWIDAQPAELAALVAARTGLRLDPYFVAPKVRWLLDHTPGARAMAERGWLGAATMDTWLIGKLTGRFVTDASTAARWLLYDIHRHEWDDELCLRFDVPRSVLPDVVERDFGDSPHGPIVASVVDQPAAMIGHGRLARGQAKATFGTGCFVYANAGTSPPTPREGLLSTIAWRRDGVTTYALDGGVFAAGAVITWLRDSLGFAESGPALDALAASAKDTAGVMCVPSLAGLAAPYWRRGVRGAWLGLSLGATRAHLVRAAYEGIAARVAQVIRAMAIDLPALRVDGGVTRSVPLMQITADLAGVPVEISAEDEATVTGACWLAARAAGVWTSDEEITRRVAVARVIEPRISADEREAHMDRFARAVERVSS
jgi:glycerol kinase